MKSVRATSPDQLNDVLGYVHDRTYELERVTFDRESGLLTLPISLRTRSTRKVLGFSVPKYGQVEGQLLIRQVKDYSIVDDAEIGLSDINIIEFEDGKVVIVGGFPVRLIADVTGLDVELLAPDSAFLA